MYAADMAYNCTLAQWESNSRVLHAISKGNPEGPYQPQKVIVPIWAHNPTIHRSPDGHYAIYHIGQGKPYHTPITNCSKNYSQSQTNRELPAIGDEWPTSANIAVSDNNNLDNFKEENSASGNWAFNNPAVWIFENGTTLIVSKISCNASMNLNKSEFCAQLVVSIAPSYKGPFKLVNYLNIYGEDPYIWQDLNGYFHMIWQSGNYKGTPFMGPGHWHTAYSKDAYHWIPANKTQAFDNNIKLTNGTVVNVGRRERHQILFNENGLPAYLFNGCGDNTFSFTSVQPMNTKS